jgi:hypothetical protein
MTGLIADKYLPVFGAIARFSNFNFVGPAPKFKGVLLELFGSSDKLPIDINLCILGDRLNDQESFIPHPPPGLLRKSAPYDEKDAKDQKPKPFVSHVHLMVSTSPDH